MTKPQEFLGRVSRVELTGHFRFFKVKLVEPKNLDFSAGQFLSVAIGGGQRRAYSIASPPRDSRLDLVVDLSPGRAGSKFMAGLKQGDEISFLAPLGRFVVENEAKLLFVATTSGIAPIRSMVLDLLNQNDPRSTYLYWYVRQADAAAFKDWDREFEQKVKARVGFYYRLVKSGGQESWPDGGRNLEKIKTLGGDKNRGVYLCGSQKMLAGFPQSRVHVERF